MGRKTKRRVSLAPPACSTNMWARIIDQRAGTAQQDFRKKRPALLIAYPALLVLFRAIRGAIHVVPAFPVFSRGELPCSPASHARQASRPRLPVLPALCALPVFLQRKRALRCVWSAPPVTFPRSQRQLNASLALPALLLRHRVKVAAIAAHHSQRAPPAPSQMRRAFAKRDTSQSACMRKAT